MTPCLKSGETLLLFISRAKYRGWTTDSVVAYAGVQSGRGDPSTQNRELTERSGRCHNTQVWGNHLFRGWWKQSLQYVCSRQLFCDDYWRWTQNTQGKTNIRPFLKTTLKSFLRLQWKCIWLDTLFLCLLGCIIKSTIAVDKNSHTTVQFKSPCFDILSLTTDVEQCLHMAEDTISLCNMHRCLVSSSEAVMSVCLSVLWKPFIECLLFSLTAHSRETRSVLTDAWKYPDTYAGVAGLYHHSLELLRQSYPPFTLDCEPLAAVPFIRSKRITSNTG